MAAAAAQSQEEEDGAEGLMTFEISKLVNGLVDPLVSKRFEALQNTQAWLLSCFRLEPQGFPHVVEDVVAKPLLRRFADQSEKCRCLSIRIFSDILKLSPRSIAPLLPYILPVISERFPLESIQQNSTNLNVEEVQYKAITLEQSEEVRLLLVQLVHQLLKQGRRLIVPFASDIASILMSAASDKDPCVLVEVFSTLRFFAELIGDNLKSISKSLISATLHALHNKRCRVRVAALQAIEKLVLCGAHSCIYDLTAYRDPNIIPIRDFYHPSIKTQYLALLASDRSLMVREALLRTVACWLLELPERREHEVRLLPYVLNGFRDENKEIQELAFDLMECIGQQYEKENEDEVRDKKQYLPEDIESSKKYTNMAPFLKQRPCLGARIMVRSSFGILFHALSADLQAWQDEPKILAAELLYILIVFVEDDATMHLQAMIITMIKACPNALIEKKIEECARALGCFIDPSSYLEILIPHITGEYNTDASMLETGKTLKVLSWMMMGSPPVLLTCHIPEICSMLTHENLMTSLQQEVHLNILSILEVIVAAFNETCRSEVVTILWILLNVYAIGEIRKKSCQERINLALEGLCKCLSFQRKCDFIGTYLDDLINLLEPPQNWSSTAVDPIICERLLEESILLRNPAISKLFNMLEEFASLNKEGAENGCSRLTDRVAQLQMNHTSKELLTL